MQYTLFNLHRCEIAEILGMSQLAPGLVLLSPVYGENWDTIFFCYVHIIFDMLAESINFFSQIIVRTIIATSTITQCRKHVFQGNKPLACDHEDVIKEM